MGSPYIGEIRMFAGNFAPQGWALCQGQLMAIAENDALFNLIGTTYGGDGQETFGLPDLQGRAPVHMGTGPGLQSYTIGQEGGVESVTLTLQQMPTHTHPVVATTNSGTDALPQNKVPAAGEGNRIYLAAGPDTNIAATAVTPVGGSQPHENLQPYIVVTYIISLYGVYPTQS
jgi:microcystin-dependent protein